MNKKWLFPIRKGKIVQGFGENEEFYKKRFPELEGGHQGIDIVSYHGDDIFIVEDGITYKVFDYNSIGIRGIKHGYGFNMISLPDKNNICNEYIFWHMMSNIKIKIGQLVKQGDLAGYEGQSGYVYSDGALVPDSEKGKPPYRGTHLHFSKRIVLRTHNVTPGDKLLSGINGKAYFDNEGYYYKILNYNNGHQGFVDPLLSPYMMYDEFIGQNIINISKDVVEVIPTLEKEEDKKKLGTMLLHIINQFIEYLKGRTEKK